MGNKQNHVGLVWIMHMSLVDYVQRFMAACAASRLLVGGVACQPGCCLSVAETDFAAWWSEIRRHVAPSAPWRSATCKQPPTGASANTSPRPVCESEQFGRSSVYPPHCPCHTVCIHCRTSQPVVYWQTDLGLIASSGFIFTFVKYQEV